LVDDEPRLRAWFDAVRDHLLLPQGALELPLDVQGTAFQARVWQALRRIPVGMTVAYGELARQLGDPRAVRAVAAACARNPVAVVVPCHRVVGSNGQLTGYRWGLDRKRRLLAAEGAV
jgi:AraC family transcriptional regulator of adaptative response/methylated-DNA-[protein]-cysteine methyltransferase